MHDLREKKVQTIFDALSLNLILASKILNLGYKATSRKSKQIHKTENQRHNTHIRTSPASSLALAPLAQKLSSSLSLNLITLLTPRQPCRSKFPRNSAPG